MFAGLFRTDYDRSGHLSLMDLQGKLTCCSAGGCSFIMFRWRWFPQTLSPGFCLANKGSAPDARCSDSVHHALPSWTVRALPPALTSHHPSLSSNPRVIKYKPKSINSTHNAETFAPPLISNENANLVMSSQSVLAKSLWRDDKRVPVGGTSHSVPRPDLSPLSARFRGTNICYMQRHWLGDGAEWLKIAAAWVRHAKATIVGVWEGISGRFQTLLG